jgi:hypothetical protein
MSDDWTPNDEVVEFFSEAVHTAFRKGADGEEAAKVWKAIRAMPPDQWASAIDWMLWCMHEVGYEFTKVPEE